MRTFYVFKIKNEYATLTKSNPYYLFKMLSYIYYMDVEEINKGVKLFNNMTDTFNTKKLDIELFKNYRNNYFYIKYKNVHQLNNLFKKEETKLTIRKKFLLLQSTVIRPSFLNDLARYPNLFLCDFVNKDYFWIENLYNYL